MSLKLQLVMAGLHYLPIALRAFVNRSRDVLRTRRSTAGFKRAYVLLDHTTFDVPSQPKCGQK